MQNKNKFIPWITAVVYFGLGGLLTGIILENRSSSTDQEPTKKEFAQSDSTQSSPQQTSTKKSQTSSKLHQSSPETTLIDRLASSNPKLYQKLMAKYQKSALIDMISEMPVEDPKSMLSMLDEVRDPKVQMAIIEKLTDYWSRSDPKAAYTWLQSQKDRIDENRYGHFRQTIFEGMIAQDPEHAWKLINTMNDPEVQNALMEQLASGWVAKNPEQAFNWLESIAQTGTDPNQVAEYYSLMMQTYIQVDPYKATTVIKDLEPGRMLDMLVFPAAGRLAADDLGGAMEWVQSLDSRSTEGVLKSLIARHANGSADAIFDHLFDPSYAPKISKTLLASAFYSISEHYPERAVAKLDMVPEDARPEAMAAIARNWLHSDEKKASEWLENQLPAEVRDTVLEASVSHYMYTNPVKAMTWAVTINNPEKTEELLTSIINEAEEKHLYDIQQSLDQAALSDVLRTRLQSQLDQRTNHRFSQLVLP